MQGCSQDFSKGRSPDCHYGQDIIMAFSPPVVGCLVKKRLQKGGSREPQDPPLVTPLLYKCPFYRLSLTSHFIY